MASVGSSPENSAFLRKSPNLSHIETRSLIGMKDAEFIAIARYLDQREALLVDRVESQIRQVESQQTQLARKVEEIAHGAKPHKDSRR
jgi:hypothetical protein